MSFDHLTFLERVMGASAGLTTGIFVAIYIGLTLCFCSTLAVLLRCVYRQYVCPLLFQLFFFST
jgi:hypothetical protein